jgi:hypothetical protein
MFLQSDMFVNGQYIKKMRIYMLTTYIFPQSLWEDVGMM